MAKQARERVGGSFRDFLAEEGLLETCEAQAIKEILAMQLVKAMDQQGISKAEMSRRMQTSRPALDRLLDAQNHSVTLNTLQRAAEAVGKRLHMEIR